MISVVQPDGHADGGLAVRPVLLGLEDVAPDEVLDPTWLTLRPMIKIFCRKVTVYDTKFRVLCCRDSLVTFALSDICAKRHL
jgi:hypothetical protein